MTFAVPPPGPLVLVVDDETAITDSLAPYLRREGFRVTCAADGEQALALVEGCSPAAIVLDVLLPGMDGRAVLRTLRHSGWNTPVILLTAFGEAGERARALDEGADDYLNKPFDPGELVARLRAVLRRASPDRRPLVATERVRAGRLLVDRVARRAWVDRTELALTPKAAALLDYLVTHPDELLTRERLLDVLWGYDYPLGTRAVDHRIAELRRCLGDDAGSPSWIETVPGAGYRFCAEVLDAG